MGTTKSILFNQEQNELANYAKVLGHPARIAIIQYLVEADSCVNGDLVDELGLAQATISQHLKELKNAELIQGSIEGTKICYCINPVKWKEVQEKINQLFKQLDHKRGDCC